ncbi:MAG: hypothetical protein HRT52_23285 [Colwellia sp.]|nr:hypothetical protein [Colwellia sp.]
MKNFCLTLLFITLLMGCSSQTHDIAHWKGESLSQLIEVYGAPANFLKLSDGNRVIEFHHSINKLSGNTCTLSFMLDRENKVLGGHATNGKSNCA